MITEVPPAIHQVCDLDRIYNDSYSYSLPRVVLEGLLSGEAFDNQKKYSEEELARVQLDIQNIYQKIMAENPIKAPLAVITAGAPGAGKTTILEQDREGRAVAYADPDAVCLKKQELTYLTDVAANEGSPESRLEAYNKWRPASNAAAHIILGNLIREKYAFYFGTTSSSPMTYKFFEFLKSQGYEIKLLHIIAPDDVRIGSIQERDKTFIQTTAQDIAEKGDLTPQRINDTFFKYADEIDFYYRKEVHEDAILAAKWKDKHTTVIDSEAYEQMIRVHNLVADKLQREDLKWEFSVSSAERP